MIRVGDSVFNPLLFNATLPQTTGERRHFSHSVRFSGFRISLLTAPSHLFRQWHLRGFRSRLQRRVRDGFSPSSLKAPKGA